MNDGSPAFRNLAAMLVSESRRRPGSARPSPMFPHEAQRLLADGSFQQAMEVCRQGLVHFPDQIAGYMILSQAFLAMGKRDRAVNVLHDGFLRTGAPQLEDLHRQLLQQSFQQSQEFRQPGVGGIPATKRLASPFTRVADSPNDTAHAQSLVSVPLPTPQPELPPTPQPDAPFTLPDAAQLPEPAPAPVALPPEVIAGEIAGEVAGETASAMPPATPTPLPEEAAEPVATVELSPILEPAEETIRESEAASDGAIDVASIADSAAADSTVAEVVAEAEAEAHQELSEPIAPPVEIAVDAPAVAPIAVVDAPSQDAEVSANESAGLVADSVVDAVVVDAPIPAVVPPPFPDFTIPDEGVAAAEIVVDAPPAAAEAEPIALPAKPLPAKPLPAPPNGTTAPHTDDRTFRLLAAGGAEERELPPSSIRPISVLAIHKGSNVSRLRSANLRLIPGLEFAPLRHEESARKQAIAPLINQPMPGPELPGRATAKPATPASITSTTPSQTGAAFTLPAAANMPPLPPLHPPAAPAQKEPQPVSQPATPPGHHVQQAQGDAVKKESGRGRGQSAVGGRESARLPHSTLPDSTEVAAGQMTPLEELAKRLESARIPVVEDEEHHRPVPFEPSIVSDTLANILVAQGAYAEALKAFQTLARTKPERLDYYEARIAEMKRRLSEQPPLH